MTALRIIAIWAAVAGLALTGCGGSKKATGGARPGSAGSGAGTSGAGRSNSTGSTTTKPAPPALGSREVSPGVIRAGAPGLTATMRVSGHHPRVDGAWPVSFTVARAGKPVKAEVRYQYLFAGQVVARRSHYRFTGAFRDIFRWPASAVGYPLTFRAVITAAGATLNLDYPVQVQR